MPSQKNQDSVKNLTEKLSRSKTVVLSDYRGLSVNLQRKLRNEVKTAGGELIVAKNSLLKLALKAEKLELPKDLEASLLGPTITLFAYEDEIAPIKALFDFAKANELPVIKVGFLAKEPLTADQVKQLASLPTKIELITKTVYTLKGPLFGLVNVLSGNIRKLIYVLSDLAKAKPDQGEVKS